MGLLSKLFRKRDPPAKEPAPRHVSFATFHFSDSFVDIRKYDMFGQFARSPNGRYLLVWRDSSNELTNDNSRTVKGRYMLFDGELALCDARMERPNDGKVADTGVFILNDWRYFTAALRGTE